MAGSESTPSSIIENLNGISIREKGSKKPRGWRSPISGTVWNSPSPDIIRRGNHTRQYPTLKDSNGSNGSVKSLEKVEESGGAGNSLNGPAFSRDQGEAARLSVKRKKDFMCMERVKGKMINILEGLELHTGVFSAAEQKRIVDYVYEIQEMGRKRQLRDRTYSEPRKWMRGKGRVTIQFGCCYNYATDKDGNPPGIIRDEDVDPLPPLLKSMIKRMVEWHVLPPTCIPNSCIVNIYDKDDCIPPHIDHHDFVRPFCTVSFLTQCNILFGTELKVLGPGDFSGSTAIPLPMGSVLILNGNGADVAKHCVPAVPAKRISITFRKMDDSKLPFRFKPDPELMNLHPLPFPLIGSPVHRVGTCNVSVLPLQKDSQIVTPPSQGIGATNTRLRSEISKEKSTSEKKQLEVSGEKSTSPLQLGADDFPPLGFSKPLRRPNRSLRQ